MKRLYNIGMPINRMNQVYSVQKKTLWCWSACIQMVLNYFGIRITQRDLARPVCGADIFGNPKNCAAYNSDITRSINLRGHDRNRNYFEAKAPLREDGLSLKQLYRELLNEQPVIVAYKYSWMKMGHAVIISGAECYEQNGFIYFNKLVIRDPEASAYNQILNGRQEIIGSDAITEFLSAIYGHWYVEVNIARANKPDYLKWF